MTTRSFGGALSPQYNLLESLPRTPRPQLPSHTRALFETRAPSNILRDFDDEGCLANVIASSATGTTHYSLCLVVDRKGKSWGITSGFILRGKTRKHETTMRFKHKHDALVYLESLAASLERDAKPKPEGAS